ncbi:MAG: hypothetical protein D6743_02505 [Calditrichaeota bacterium]|nr:MAG: hypothetical protein D6743_02505 [Calditrichota bacterium]
MSVQNAKRLFLRLGVFAGLFLCGTVSAVQACPGCNSILDGTLGYGFNMSTLFLMAMPFFVAGSMVLGFVFVKRITKEHLETRRHFERTEKRGEQN